jgi:hypothetical protein
MTDRLFLTEASTPMLTREDRRALRAELSHMSMGLVVHLRGTGCRLFDESNLDAIYERLMGVHGLYGYGFTISPTRPDDTSLRV